MTTHSTPHPSRLSDGAPTSSPRQLIFICGSGHSGSTLLDMLLGGHQMISSLGEAIFLYFNLRSRTPADRCTCGSHVTACPFWIAVDREVGALLPAGPEPALLRLLVADPRQASLRDDEGRFRARAPDEPPPFRSRLNEALLLLGSSHARRWASSISREVALRQEISSALVLLYEAVRRAHGTPVVVDSTKNPSFAKGVRLSNDVPTWTLFLVRDGRAVCHSRMTREGISMAHAVRMWRAEQIKRSLAHLTVPRSQTLPVRYEDLCERTASVLADICEFVGLGYDPQMLDFRSNRHNLGGNPMRFRDAERDIVCDSTWQRALRSRDLATFRRIGGAWNRRLGYTD